MRQYTSHERSLDHRRTTRELRRRLTEAEGLLWERLRDRRLGGLKFRRQHPVGRFVVDFYCVEAGVAVELDGSVHDGPEQREADAVRQEFLESQQLRVLRFQNDEVFGDIERVLATIEAFCRDSSVQAPPLHDVERGPGGEVHERA